MFDLILIAFLSYRNGVKAKLKEQNAILWGFVTVLAYLVFMVVGLFIVILNFCKDTVNLNMFSSLDVKTREAAQQQLLQVFAANPLHMVTVELFGVGGYLLVRYILDKKPDKKQPEVHWMDRMGDNI
jgi:hypothetical protein